MKLFFRVPAMKLMVMKQHYRATFTIRGVTKLISLNVDFAGIVIDPSGQTKAGFSVTGKISRKEFGLLWNAVTEAGTIVAGDEIRINAEIQLIKQV